MQTSFNELSEEGWENISKLCFAQKWPPQSRIGRPRKPLSDIVWCMINVFLLEMKARQYVEEMDEDMHFNTIYNHFCDPEMTPILERMAAECGGADIARVTSPSSVRARSPVSRRNQMLCCLIIQNIRERTDVAAP